MKKQLSIAILAAATGLVLTNPLVSKADVSSEEVTHETEEESKIHYNRELKKVLTPHEKFAHGLEYDRLGEYEKAFDHYSKAAQAGHVQAMFNLAVAYDTGEGVKEDKAEAFKWYQKSASLGEIASMHNLGIIYLLGLDGVAVDKELGLKLLEEAAAEGFAASHHELYEIYKKGEHGVQKDVNRALEHLHIAAHAGHSESMFKAAMHHAHGEHGLPKNPAVAHHYMMAAHYNGHPEAHKHLDALAKQIHAGNLQMAHHLALEEWLEQGAEEGVPEANWRLARIILADENRAHEHQKAVEHLAEAATLGHPEALHDLAVLHDHGNHIIKRDPAKALHYYNLAHHNGSKDAAYSLGIAHLNGDGVEVDIKKAVNYLEEAAAADDAEGKANYTLGWMYEEGKIDGTENLGKALNHYLTASTKGSGDAQYRLGEIYLNGHKGVIERSVPASQHFLELAVKNGNEKAKELLNSIKRKKN